MDTAMAAVNEGNIFRFLTKPCSKEDLSIAIETALAQHRLINAEKELLEQTLRGSVSVLSEVLSFSNPAAFGRAMRLHRFVQHVTGKLQLKSTWQFEIAAMLSQLGCVTLPPELISAAFAGESLNSEDKKKYEAHPVVAWEMLSRIPRMGAIAQMIAAQNNPKPQIESKNPEEKREIEFGIQLLRAGLEIEGYLSRGFSPVDAVRKVRTGAKGIDLSILQTLDGLTPLIPMQPRECAISELAAGMILQEDLCNSDGLLIVAKGQELTYQWIKRLEDCLHRGVIRRRVKVSMPENVAA